MTPRPEHAPPESKETSARRSKRVNLAIPIVLSGTNRSGDEFRESTRTIVVSKHGAKIKTTQVLDAGAIVTIENRSLALAAHARVVRVSAKQSPGVAGEIGVELTQAGNVWGIIFPPEDWETGPHQGLEIGEEGVTPQAPETTAVETSAPVVAKQPEQPARGPEGPIPEAATASPPAAAPAPPLAPALPSGPGREKIDAIVTAVLAKLSPQLDQAADAQLKAYTDKVIRFTNQFALRVQANFQEAANRTEDQMVVLIQQKLGNLADRVQASRTTLESLLARFEALQKTSKAWVEDTDQKMREASQLALESALQELDANLRKGVESTSATLEAECQKLVVDAVTRTVNATLAKADEQLAVQTKNRLLKANAELKWQQEQMIDGIKEQLNQIAVAGTTNLSAKLETIGEELVPALGAEMEKSLQEAAGNLAAQTTQSLQEQIQLLSQDALISLQQAVQGLQDRMQEESRKVRQSSEQEISKTAEAFSRTVAQRAELAVGAVESAAEQGASKMKASQLESARSLKAGVEDYQRQLAARSGVALENFQAGLQALTREMQEGAAQLFSQKLQCMAEDAAEASAEKLRERVEKEADAATETFSRESEKRLSARAEDFFASSAKELQERLRSQADAQLEAALQSAPEKFNERLTKMTQEAGLTLVKETQSELQKLASSLLQSTSETLRTEVGQLSGNLQKDLKAFQANLAEQARNQLLSMSRSTVETLNKQALAGIEEFRTRLQKAGQESREESLRELETSFREAVDKQRAALSALLQEQAEQSRELAGLQIKALGDQVVAKATEALDRQVGKNTRTVTELGEQARAGVETQIQKIEAEAQKSILGYQRQIEQSSDAALDKFRKETGVLLEEVVFRLQQSVRSFQTSTGSEVISELQKASDNLLEVSAAQMRKQTEQTLELITERLKEKEEEVVSDAANVFRSRIADIFAILQEGSKKTSDHPDPERLKKQS